ncbi:hypothetical protein PR202_gb28883 [Eleusine coracana subsp. coracana]|uniref:Uncharacterized protein n=1 Tax=Eleusine coracana subsp. coracana TaxID=191504 RepID=A0AAV5FXM7_ELECO|nr:hypothetical protein PR202_gb28883 [Eleusine coracana subsp. coracana]
MGSATQAPGPVALDLAQIWPLAGRPRPVHEAMARALPSSSIAEAMARPRLKRHQPPGSSAVHDACVLARMRSAPARNSALPGPRDACSYATQPPGLRERARVDFHAWPTVPASSSHEDSAV